MILETLNAQGVPVSNAELEKLLGITDSEREGFERRLGAMQRDQAVRGPHELHAGPARLRAGFQLVGHDLGDGQFRYRSVQCPLQSLSKGEASDRTVEEKRFGFAI